MDGDGWGWGYFLGTVLGNLVLALFGYDWQGNRIANEEEE